MFNQWPSTGVILLLGKEALALQYAKKILCENSDRSGALFDSKTHTDFKLIQPESKSQWIKVDQIRELIDWAGGRPQIANQQVAIISPAHALNIQSANALLKTLEESSPEALFILVTDRPSFIPATIRSRCYWIRCREVGNEEKVEDLSLKIQIMNDLNLLNTKKADPISIASQWTKQDPKQVVYWLIVVLIDQLKNTLPRNKQWWFFLDKVFDAKRELEVPNQPNIQLLMESLLIDLNIRPIYKL